MTTWDEGKFDRQTTTVSKRLENILCLTSKGEGGNDLVESKRGKKNCDLKFDLMLNTANIAKLEKDVVVNTDVKEDTIDLCVENDGKEMIKFNKVVV